MSAYPSLFSAGRIGGVSTKNRIAMPALGTGFAERDGRPSPELIAYFEERFRGGIGLAVSEITRVNEVNGIGMRSQLGLARDDNVAPAMGLVEAAHRLGCAFFFQLHHPGRNGHPALNPSRDIVAPSPLPSLPGGIAPRELEAGEIRGLVGDFVRAAERAQAAGADGVELHAAHGYLIGEFLSPYSNKRSDEYGGSFENRTRFLKEILVGIRERCGGLATLVRLSVDEFLPLAGLGGPYVDLDEGVRIAKACEAWGADGIDVSSGIPVTGFTTVEGPEYPEGWKGNLGAAVKTAVGLPVIAVNRLVGPKVAESMLEAGQADFAALGRQLIADPDWPAKVSHGRETEIRRCKACRACIQRNALGMRLDCAAYPFTDP